MNIRKNIDYSEMYAALDTAMAAETVQMELYTKIGQAVCRRTEKGAAIAAAEYLRKCYPDVHGVFPGNLCLMREKMQIESILGVAKPDASKVSAKDKIS